MIIRLVEAGEIGDLSVMASRVYAETFGASMSKADIDAQLRTTRSQDYFRKAMTTDAILVALMDGVLIGYVQLSDVRIPIEGASAADQELYALYIRSDRQGTGVGKALIEAALAHERFRNARNIYLDVWEENMRALGFYTRYGFRTVGWRDFVMNGRVLGSDLVMMREAAIQSA